MSDQYMLSVKQSPSSSGGGAGSGSKLPILEQVVAQNKETTDRIMKNATGYVVSNNALQIAVATSFDNATASTIIRKIGGILVYMSQSAVRDIDPSDDVISVRISTRKCEYMIAPEDIFSVYVVQEHSKTKIAQQNV